MGLPDTCLPPRRAMARARIPLPRSRLAGLTLAVGAGWLSLSLLSTAAVTPAATLDDIPGACRTITPYFAVARYPAALPPGALGAEPALVAFRQNTPDNPADQVLLASQAQVGSTFGLAYDATAKLLYAAAYHKRGAPFGPGGPGAVYRVDLATGDVRVLARLTVGPDTHNLPRNDDAGAAAGVGQTGLGGLALNGDGTELYVANLSDGKIYRLDAETGDVLGSFDNGGKGEAWARAARPFALAWREGALYHGVVKADDPPAARVYRSAPDGAGLSTVLAFDLAYGRRPPWFQWDTFGGGAGTAQPLLTDIAFRPTGDMVLGLRDRRVDMTVFGTGAAVIPGGDLVPAWFNGARWQATLQPEFYADDSAADEIAWGGLALVPGLDTLVAAAADAQAVPGGRALVGGQALWFDNRLGARNEAETLYQAPSAGRNATLLHGLGDVTVLCDPNSEYPELGATATAAAGTAAHTATVIAARTISPTLTAEATVRWGTETAVAATATAGAPATATAYAERRGRMFDSCGTDNPMFFITVHSRDLDPGNVAHEPSVLALDDTATDDLGAHVTLATQGQVGAIYGLAQDLARNQLYAGAFHKRGTFFGPGGPGGVYRIDLATGDVQLWATLPAGPDYHQLGTGFDAPAAEWATKVGLGDIELSDDGSTLFVMNLWDRRIWRFSVPDGAQLPPLAIGAATEGWFDDARPFGLGFRDGWLYHGVVDTVERLAAGGVPVAYVYRSRPDGGEMTEVARFDMDYTRPGGMPWSRWNAGPGVHQPVLSDIEFRPDGGLILGLRDRLGDAQILTIAQGDLLPTRRNGERWDVITDPEFYADRLAHDETTWGGLAAFPGRDAVVTSALAPVTINSGGALWYDNVTGLLERRESVYLTFVGGIMLPTFAKGQGLGDMEALCPSHTVPTPTHTLTLTLTPTATPTLTPTATPTRVPGPIYLPVIVREACSDRVQRADVVVVLDMSTSMSRTTGSGRQKLLAAQEAVRAFLDRMVLTPGPGGFDQVAVVGFNRTWWLQQGLTNDRAALERAIADLPLRQVEGTRIDLAVEGGLAALSAPERDPAHTPVMVLLTDGLPQMVPTPAPSGSPADTVLAAARRAKAAGVRLYTVGLGQATDIDPRLLTEMASRPDMFYFAPDAEDLAQIYAEIAYTIACPRGRHDWARPWP